MSQMLDPTFSRSPAEAIAAQRRAPPERCHRPSTGGGRPRPAARVHMLLGEDYPRSPSGTR
jgi:hypothetical protein